MCQNFTIFAGCTDNTNLFLLNTNYYAEKNIYFRAGLSNTLDLYTAPVESGFAQSLDGTGGIKDWEEDGDGLEF